MIFRRIVPTFILMACLFSSVEAQSGEEIILGVASSLSVLEGRESLEAVQLAVDEINSRGGVRVGGEKRLIRIEAVDLSDALPKTSIANALDHLETFIVEKKVHAVVVGPFRSEILLAGMDIFARHKIPLLSAIAMSTAMEAKILKDPKYKYIFRVGFNSKYLVEYLISTMKLLQKQYGFNRVYIMNQDAAWARTTASLMARLYFDRSDWKIIGIDNYPSGTSDFSAGLMKAKDNGAEILLLIFDMPESGLLVKQWDRLGGQALLCGFLSPMVGPGAWQSFDGKIAGTLNVIFELGNIPSPRWGPSMVFHKAFTKKYGRQIEAGHGPAPAYESVFILAEAIEKAAGLEPDKIVKALESTDRTGVMGRIRFHRGHQVIFGDELTNDALACIIQWGKDGQRKIVYPLSIADADIELPPALPQ
jgi:branched-chain amino acid transport system substrate-binding protein